MQNTPSTLVERLQAHCLAKPGILPSITFGEKHPSYHVLGDFLRSFAKFFLDEHPVRLQLRCRDSDLKSAQGHIQMQIAQEMHWGGPNWKWVDVWLEETSLEAEVLRLLDSSYDICMSELHQAAVHLIGIAEQASTQHDALRELIDLYQLTHRSPEITALR